MTTETTHASAGGFAGDPAEAFATPASAGGCCSTQVDEAQEHPLLGTGRMP